MSGTKSAGYTCQSRRKQYFSSNSTLAGDGTYKSVRLWSFPRLLLPCRSIYHPINGYHVSQGQGSAWTGYPGVDEPWCDEAYDVIWSISFVSFTDLSLGPEPEALAVVTTLVPDLQVAKSTPASTHRINRMWTVEQLPWKQQEIQAKSRGRSQGHP